MRVKLTFAIILIALNAHPTGATAQNVYKCGNNYSEQPCPGGTVVESSDARAQTQKVQAGTAAARDAKAADAMEKARLKAEAQAAPAYIPPPKPDTMDTGRQAIGKPKKPEVFIATVPGKPGEKAAGKKKKKAKKKPSA